MSSAPVKTVTLRAGAAIAAAGCLLGMLSACSPEPEPTPTKTALFASEEEAFAAAEETYRAFVDAQNAVDTLDEKTFEAVYHWTVDDAYAAVRESLTQLHAERVSLTGDSKITMMTPRSAHPTTGDISMHVCVDVSNTDLIGTDGESLVPENRADVQSLLVEFKPASSDDTLRVSRTVGDETACAE